MQRARGLHILLAFSVDKNVDFSPPLNKMKMKEQIELLERVLGYINVSPIMNAVYISPAQQLRNEANEIEQKERDTYALREFIQSLKDPQTKQ